MLERLLYLWGALLLTSPSILADELNQQLNQELDPDEVVSESESAHENDENDETPSEIEEKDGTETSVVQEEESTLELNEVSLEQPVQSSQDDVEGDILIDATHFPDEYFREYVKRFDQNNDGVLSQEEREAVEEINLYNPSIDEPWVTSVEGIELFPNLEEFAYGDCRLTSLDLSNNTLLADPSAKFNGFYQTYKIQVDENIREFDLSTLPENFDVNRTFSWQWGNHEINGEILTVEIIDPEDLKNPDTIRYFYATTEGNKDSNYINVDLKIE